MYDSRYNSAMQEMPQTNSTRPVWERPEALFRRQWLSLYFLYLIAFPLAMVVVETRELHGPTLCVFRQVTHLNCPGCGLTRAFRAMGRLDVGGAIRYNPLGPALFAVAVICWGYALGMVVTKGRLRMPAWWMRWRARLLWGGVILYLLVGAVRIVYEIRYPPPPPSSVQLNWRAPFSFLGK